MFKLSKEELDKMKEEIKELKKKIDRLEFIIKMNERDSNENKDYEGSNSDFHLNYGNKYPKGVTFIEPTLGICESPFECCKNCPNNYKNNPSGGGVCSCDLPYREMFRW